MALVWHYMIFTGGEISIRVLLKDWGLENNTNLNSIFCLIKSSEIVFISLPAFYLIIWLMASPKNFEK